MVRLIVITLLFMMLSACKHPAATADSSQSLSEQMNLLKQQGYQVFTYKEGDKEFLMQQYFMVQLLSGPNDSIPEEQLEDLQSQHLQYLSDMYALGHASLIGPMNEGGDWRGIVIYNTPTLQQADSLARQDPYVKSGALKVKTTGWWTQKGGSLR